MISLDFSKKSVFFITGASRGIGRTISTEIARLSNPSTFILIASNKTELEKTKTLIHQINSTINVQIYTFDLSKPNIEDYKKLFENVIKSIGNVDFAYFIHNAGSTGVIKKTLDLKDVDVWRSYYDLNLFSAVTLNSLFVEKFRAVASKVVVVNITSMCGNKPFENLAMYGSAKAARELFFKVLAVEEPDVIVLNYSPGPVETDMFEGIIQNAQSENVRKGFAETKNTSVLTTNQTVDRLLGILQKGDFKSGDTIDYFDRL